jgi:hypothetical protein
VGRISQPWKASQRRYQPVVKHCAVAVHSREKEGVDIGRATSAENKADHYSALNYHMLFTGISD